jgi:hypothetical protein
MRELEPIERAVGISIERTAGFSDNTTGRDLYLDRLRAPDHLYIAGLLVDRRGRGCGVANPPAR